MNATHKVVRVIARLNVGGPALNAMHLSVGLSSRYPTILVTGQIGPDEADMTDVVRAKGVTVEIIPALGREIDLWNDIRVCIALYRLFRRSRPDIVHTHTAKAGTLGRVAALLARVPVRVHTFHGNVLREYFGPIKTGLFIQIERLLGRATTMIVAISPSQADELVDEFQVCDRRHVRIIPLGLDLARFERGDARERRNRFRTEIDAKSSAVITCVGRIVPIKNHVLLLEAFAKALAAGIDAILVIVGGGSEEARSRDHAERLGISQRVRFLGWRSDLETIYSGSDIVALSSDNEGTPVCLIEALASRCAVVSTNVGGVADVLENGRLGLLVPPKTGMRWQTLSSA